MNPRLATKSIFVFIVFFSLFLLVGNLALQAQDATPTPTPENEELKKLKQQNEILAEQQKTAEAQKAIAEANKATAEANKVDFPKPTSTPLTGDTTIDANVKIETEMMAYRALQSVGIKIASEVEPTVKGKKVAILNDQWLLGMRDYWGNRNKLKMMNESYQKILEKPIFVPLNPFSLDVNNNLIGQIIKGPTTPAFVASLEKEKNELIASFKSKSNSKDKSKLIEDIKALTALTAMMAATDGGSGINESTTETKKEIGFAGTAAAIGSAFGGVGSVVGAAIDLMALARTDTKITGFTFTPQESALVSSVYANLDSATRFYPAEFSPNLNLQNQPTIIIKTQEVADLKEQFETTLSNIETSEKVFQDLKTAKDALETRKKQLPDEITAIKAKIDNHAKDPKGQADLKDKLDDLNLENSVGLPKKIKQNAAAIEKIELKLSQLYSEIKPVAASGAIINGFIEIASEIDTKGNNLLLDGRTYTLEELEGLTEGKKEVKELLLKEAEKKKGGSLTDKDKSELLNPIDLDRLSVFVKVGKYIRENKIKDKKNLETRVVPRDFLSDVEQLYLVSCFDEKKLNLTGCSDVKFLETKETLAKEQSKNIIKLKSLNKQFDKFYEDIIKPDALGINPITKNLQTENMMDAFGCDKNTGECKDSFALVLKVIDTGGNNQVKKNLLTMVATGDNVSHSGGAIVEFKLYNLNGNIQKSSICSSYESYQKAKNIMNGNSIATCNNKGSNVKTDDEADDEADDGKGKKTTKPIAKPELKKPE